MGSWLGLARGIPEHSWKKDQWCLKVVSALPAVRVSGLSGLQVPGLLSCWGCGLSGCFRPWGGPVRALSGLGLQLRSSPGQCVPGLSGLSGL